MSNAFIQALLMDDPDGGGGAWPDPPGGSDPPDPGSLAGVNVQPWYEITFLNRTHSSIAFGNGRFVIGDISGANATAQWSSDYGSTWNAAATAFPGFGYSLRLCFGDGLFFADVNFADSAYSADGDTWTVTAAGGVSAASGPWFGNGLFFVVSGDSFNTWSLAGGWGLVRSTGLSPDYSGNAGTYGLGLYVMCGAGGSCWSSDLITWTAGTGSGSAWLSSPQIAFGNGTFVILPTSTGVDDNYSYSTDGKAWTAATLPALRSWRDVIFSNGVFLACARKLSGEDSSALAYSSDGITWTLSTAPAVFTSTDGFTHLASDESNHYVAMSTLSTTFGNASVPTGGAYSCISPEIGNKAAYTVSTVGDGYTGTSTSFSDVATPYGDGIRISNNSAAVATDIYKQIPSGDVTYVAFKFRSVTSPPDDNGALILKQGFTTGSVFALIPGREAFYDALKRPQIIVRQNTSAGWSTVNCGASALTLGQWYSFELEIASGVLTWSIRTADTDVLHSSGTVAGVWSPIAVDTFSLWQDGNVNTGESDFAALRLCGYADPSIPGTERLTGIGMTATAGDMNSPAGFRRLTGQAMTAAAGSVSVFNANRTVALTGQNLTTSRGSLAALPYPDLLSDTREFIFSPVWESIFIVAWDDGTYTVSETEFSASAYTGRWLAPTTLDALTVESSYRGTALTNYGAGTVGFDGTPPGAIFSVSSFAATNAQKVHHFSVTVVPMNINPRYGEVGYQGVLRFKIALKRSGP